MRYGLIGRTHPRLRKVFERPLSATSLKVLLRDPIRFTWRYALGWKQPEEADEPLRVDGLAFGNLVHGLLRTAVDALEAAGGLAAASPAQVDDAIGRALESTVTEWKTNSRYPPSVIWRNAIERMRQTSLAALRYPLQAFNGQKSWTEISFGTGRLVVEHTRAGLVGGQVEAVDMALDPDARALRPDPDRLRVAERRSFVRVEVGSDTARKISSLRGSSNALMILPGSASRFEPSPMAALALSAAQALDAALFSNAAASPTAPAGILNGVTPIASAGTSVPLASPMIWRCLLARSELLASIPTRRCSSPRPPWP